MSERVAIVPVQYASVVDGFIPVPGPEGPPGTGFVILGTLDDPSQLPPTGDQGDGWIIDGDLWTWVDPDGWTNVGPIQGPPGPAGSSGGFYTHVQSVPSPVWSITHGLGYPPNVTVVDSAGNQVEGDITYAADQVIVSFTAAFSGRAYLS